MGTIEWVVYIMLLCILGGAGFLLRGEFIEQFPTLLGSAAILALLILKSFYTRGKIDN